MTTSPAANGPTTLCSSARSSPFVAYRPLINLFPEATSKFCDLGGGILVGRALLTPHAAHEIDSYHQPLREDGSVANRRVLPTNLQRITNAILDGSFMFTGESMIFDDRMKLIDGRHRNQGVIATQRSVEVLLVVGVPNHTFQYLDQGAARSSATTLQLLGHANHKDKAAALRSFVCFQHYGTFDPTRRVGSQSIKQSAIATKLGSNHQTVELATSRPDLVQQVQVLRSFKQAAALLRHRGSMSALTFVLGKVDQDLLLTMLQVLNAKDEDLPGYSDPSYVPFLQLRGKLNKFRQLSVDETAALTIKAWNLVRLGQTRQNLVWKCDEEFPKIHGLAYNHLGIPQQI